MLAFYKRFLVVITYFYTPTHFTVRFLRKTQYIFDKQNYDEILLFLIFTIKFTFRFVFLIKNEENDMNSDEMHKIFEMFVLFFFFKQRTIFFFTSSNDRKDYYFTFF